MSKPALLFKAIAQAELLAAADRAPRYFTKDEARAAAQHALTATTDPTWEQPTEAQAKAGNYYKPRMTWQGLQVNIENPVGTVREGVDEGGAPWRTEFRYAYGEIAGTEGADGDPVDVYIGPYADAAEVYIVRQMRRKDWSAYDEDKVMIDFPSLEAARAAYLEHYNDPRFFGGIVPMRVAEFVRKVQATKGNPGMIKSMALFWRRK